MTSDQQNRPPTVQTRALNQANNRDLNVLRPLANQLQHVLRPTHCRSRTPQFDLSILHPWAPRV